MNKWLFAISLLLFSVNGQLANAGDKKAARLQILDKINATTSEILIDLDDRLQFRDLEILLKRCHKSEEIEKEENSALLEISYTDKEFGKPIFGGWMLSSSPAISGLEHPIYDVILLECID